MYLLTQRYPTTGGSGVSSISDYRNYVVKRMIEHPVQMEFVKEIGHAETIQPADLVWRIEDLVN